MEDIKINEKESIELIARMIKNTQNQFEENLGTPFLVWGYGTTLLSFLIWWLFQLTGNYNWQFLWFILPTVGITGSYLSNRNHPKRVKSYIDRVVDYIWLVFGSCGFIMSCISMFIWSIPILFIILLLMGMGTTLTGLVIKHKVVTICGALGTLSSLCCLFTPGLNQYIPFGLAFIIMMIIPGHVLNRAAVKQKIM